MTKTIIYCLFNFYFIKYIYLTQFQLYFDNCSLKLLKFLFLFNVNGY